MYRHGAYAHGGKPGERTLGLPTLGISRRNCKASGSSVTPGFRRAGDSQLAFDDIASCLALVAFACGDSQWSKELTAAVNRFSTCRAGSPALRLRCPRPKACAMVGTTSIKRRLRLHARMGNESPINCHMVPFGTPDGNRNSSLCYNSLQCAVLHYASGWRHG